MEGAGSQNHSEVLPSHVLAHFWVPDTHAVIATGDIDVDFALSVGDAKVGRVHHVDVAQHVVVDVAAQRSGAGFVKRHGCRWTTGVELDLKRFGIGKLVDVVPDRIKVRKVHRRSRLNDHQPGGKLPVPLGHVDGFATGGRRCAFDSNRYRCASQRLARLIHHSERLGRGNGGRRPNQSSGCSAKGSNHGVLTMSRRVGATRRKSSFLADSETPARSSSSRKMVTIKSNSDAVMLDLA